ncbi:hypothetical protein HMPREF3191_01361 [Veillonellaceae bacterium DNF00626]|nr:hypothetical protein HMPREF3191_01361 [Veillonellaceae bacterium DNF00626]
MLRKYAFTKGYFYQIHHITLLGEKQFVRFFFLSFMIYFDVVLYFLRRI